MNKSLYSKLVFIMLLIIMSLMSVVGAFLINEIRSFYLDDFYEKMKTVFENQGLANSLYSAADGSDASKHMAEIVKTFSGPLGIDSRSRNYYILNGDTGAVLEGSGRKDDDLAMTPNIITAMGGEEGYISVQSTDYMDVALPISGSTGNYIVYIIDNKSSVYELSSAMFKIILEALLIGLIIAALLSLLLAKTMVTPIQSLTRAAERVAAGDFSQKPDFCSEDEIGILTRTFNSMAGQLEDTLDDLTKSEQMRREFVANVSHELRTPITSIRSYAETLMENSDLPKQTEQDFLSVIVKESDRMTNIVSDLLTLSRFDAGSIEFQFERFSIKKTVNDVYNSMFMEAQKHNHRFTLEFKSELQEIVGDSSRIEQVLINMVSNAIKYTRDGGRIKIILGSKDDSVWVSVRDNGIGIPSDDVPKVFDRFYRVDKARSRESGGTGLGLSIAKEIVTRHNGTMELDSNIGKGTTITVAFPVEGPHEN